jgi:hypothetical protein
MSLIMRPTGLGSGVDKDIFDYSVLSGDWLIGRIYERRGFAPDIRWERHRSDETTPHPHQWRRCEPGGSQGRVSELLG